MQLFYFQSCFDDDSDDVAAAGYDEMIVVEQDGTQDGSATSK